MCHIQIVQELDSNDRRETILKAAVECIVANGLDAASVAIVAERAGVSKSLVLYHFGDRDTLAAEAWESVVERVDERIRERSGSDPSIDVTGFLQAILMEQPGINAPHAFWLEYWAQAARSENLRKEYRRRLAGQHDGLAKGLGIRKERNELRNDADPRLAADLILALASGFQVLLALDHEYLTPHQAFLAATDFLQLLNSVAE